jgi:sec-independent protein translocase protein TatB
VGTLIGKAQRYVADVKAEVNRSMELDELKKMKETVESAAQDVQKSIQTNVNDFEKTWIDTSSTVAAAPSAEVSALFEIPPEYRHPKKNWRLKAGAMPNWYKARAGVRSKALSGAARVARFRPK